MVVVVTPSVVVVTSVVVTVVPPVIVVTPCVLTTTPPVFVVTPPSVVAVVTVVVTGPVLVVEAATVGNVLFQSIDGAPTSCNATFPGAPRSGTTKVLIFSAASRPVTVIRVGSMPTRLTLATDAATVTNSATGLVAVEPVTELIRLLMNCSVVGTEIAMAKLTPLIVRPVAEVFTASFAMTCAAVSPTA